MQAWDYAIVGAGAAGCILAARLSEEASARVLLLEAGEKSRSPMLSMPCGDTFFIGNPRYDWSFATEPDPTLNNRRLMIPRGRVLGGSNAINGTIFVRGQRDDFDGWARSGAAGWSWDEVLPYFRKLEDWQGGASGTRGAGGPIRVELPRQREILCDTFIEAASQLGYRTNPDYNSGDLEGFGYYQCTHRGGRRVSVVDGYLEGARRSNLTTVTSAIVTGLRLDGRRCVGLNYIRDGRAHEVSVTREVILAAGVVCSPQLLELSGIGNPAVLERAGIRVRHALPSVGENFQDHFAARLRWRVRQPVTFNERTRGLSLLREIARYVFDRRGVLSMPIAVGFGFVRSSPSEPVPDLQFHFAPASYGASSQRRLDDRPGMTVGVYPLRPESRGSIHVRSPNPTMPPAIQPRFLSEESDLRRLIAGMRIARQLVSAAAFEPYRGEETRPGPELTSDEELRAHARAQGDTSFHPIGTCRMGSDANAVVDPRLRVHGLDGLRVIDASVMPSMVSGNTQAAAMMIAEKGAAMIREDAVSPQREAFPGTNGAAA
ncbi:GMC family oxidoreductase [Archangium lansingense]|uniref:GMC family oxidoreductase N-terminal domain-containing protein n=1 Tax=Archangium lansingense TaxID=2995310 RepID=A0ABT4ACN7_9BACT|nr:GMC family oxidoreductase N-terminal domain-containing protein [Archangium lansinium]MCY1079438.1 GMC family oxidoreductase N-terminal domain-containing protein [Archangium lansinium]